MRSIQLQTREGFQEPRPPAERDRKPHQEWTAKLRKRKTRGGWPFAAESAPGSKSNNEKRDTKTTKTGGRKGLKSIEQRCTHHRAVQRTPLLLLFFSPFGFLVSETLPISPGGEDEEEELFLDPNRLLLESYRKGRKKQRDGGELQHYPASGPRTERDTRQMRRAPASRSMGTRPPRRWRPMSPSRPPTATPPTKRAGSPPSPAAAAAASSSASCSSMAAGWAPTTASSRFMTSLMQHSRRLKMTAGFSLISRATRSSGASSAPSMDSTAVPLFFPLATAAAATAAIRSPLFLLPLSPAARGRLSYRRLTRGKSVAPTADKALVYGQDVTLLARRRSLDGQRRLRSIGSRRREASNASIIDS
ncbi:hypothetical protein BHE74_00005484 [Ensete ventricosum]|nr:hypothetical protein BHE74_00005484 [Ensete ventricosum]